MLKNGLYNVAGAITRMGINLLSIPLLIRLLGVQGYGLWTLVSAVIGLVALAEAGLALSTTIFVSRGLADGDVTGISETLTVTGGAILVLATIAAGVMWFFAPAAIHLFPHLTPVEQQAAIPALRLAGLVIWTRLPQQVLVGIEQAYQHYGLLNLLNTAQAVVLTLGLVAIASQGGGIRGLMWWQLVIGSFSLAAHIYACWKLLQPLNVRPLWNRRKGIEIGRYSILAWLTVLGSTLFTQMDRVIIGALLGPIQLGIYAAITNITAQINSFSALPVQPLLPALSTQVVQDGHTPSPLISQQVKQALQVNAVVAFGLGAVLFTLSPQLARLLLPGIATGNLVDLFQLAAVIYSLYSVNAVGYFILFAAKDVRTCMIIQLCSGVFSLIIIGIGAQWFGLRGAILGNVGYNVVWLLTVFGMRKLNLSVRQWSKWIIFPSAWFIIVSVSNYLMSGQHENLLLTLLIMELIIITVWFYRVNGLSLSYLVRGIIRWKTIQ
jgi:O-antigen/teichoic acid export membrane protein